MTDFDANKNGFTIQMALVDSLPILFFSTAAGVLGAKLHSRLFAIGAGICIAAGLGKVLWKLLLALTKTDVKLLGAQLRYLMPAGFLLMIIGVIRADHGIVNELLHGVTRMPSVLFFILAAFGIIAMIICGRYFDRRDVKGNWIEQFINTFAQACVLIGVLLL